jgi:hypothetical protein
MKRAKILTVNSFLERFNISTLLPTENLDNEGLEMFHKKVKESQNSIFKLLIDHRIFKDLE